MTTEHKPHWDRTIKGLSDDHVLAWGDEGSEDFTVGDLRRLEEQLESLRQAEEAAQVQDRVGNEGDADAIRRDAIRRVLGLGLYADSNPARDASEPVEATQGPSTGGNPSSRPGSEASSPASEPEDDGMMLRHADGTPYMDVRDYHVQRGDPPRLRYGDSNQESNQS